MPDKHDKKTKITSGTPTDNGKPMQHAKNQRDEPKSMDPVNGDQAAPPPAEKKKPDEKRGSGGIKGFIQFLNDVKTEAKKITWPPRSQVMQETWSVIVMVAFITFMVLGFDYALGNWIFGPIEHAAKMMAPATPDPLFTEVTPDPTKPGAPAPDASTPVPGNTTPITPAPDAAVPGATGSAPAPGSALPVPEGTRPNLPAPTSPSTPPAVPATTPAPVTTPPATTTPAAPQTPAPGATTPSTTAPQAPATPATPHP
jgi:preprotein translocase SecE subunit